MSEQPVQNSFLKPTEKGKANKVQRKHLVQKKHIFTYFFNLIYLNTHQGREIHEYSTENLWKSEDRLQKSVLSFIMQIPGIKIQSAGLELLTLPTVHLVYPRNSYLITDKSKSTGFLLRRYLNCIKEILLNRYDCG